jgi:hypothetical protein
MRRNLPRCITALSVLAGVALLGAVAGAAERLNTTRCNAMSFEYDEKGHVLSLVLEAKDPGGRAALAEFAARNPDAAVELRHYRTTRRATGRLKPAGIDAVEVTLDRAWEVGNGGGSPSDDFLIASAPEKK